MWDRIASPRRKPISVALSSDARRAPTIRNSFWRFLAIEKFFRERDQSLWRVFQGTIAPYRQPLFPLNQRPDLLAHM
jgi:hypothetical protein